MNLQEQEILKALWKWKLLSTAALTEIFFRGYRPASAYHRLHLLRNRGLIAPVPIAGQPKNNAFAWSLTPKGFRAIREQLPFVLKDDGYKSECPEHDLLVSAVHLGNWMKGIPPGFDLFSEQELRRLDVEQYPSWVPKTHTHRPDGYWRIKIGERFATVALEVERTQKHPTKYRATAQFYDLEKGIYRVVWVARTQGLGKLIQREAEALSSGTVNHFSVVLEDDFRKLGWNAKFCLGRDTGKTLAELLQDTQTSRKHVCAKLFLCTKISPHRSRTYVQSQKSSISDRLVPSLVSTNSPFQSPTHLKQGDQSND